MRITVVGYTTCNRVEGLQRCLSSYARNMKRYGRASDMVVVDDSRQLATRNSCRQMLQSLKRQYETDIRYGGLEEKLLFTKQLINSGSVPPDVLKFALFDTEQSRMTTSGANRNALLLDNLGEPVVSIDDDTICCIAPAPGNHRNSLMLRTSSPSYPVGVWIYHNRDEAMRSVTFVEEDFIGMHERYLGEEIQSVCKAHCPRTQTIGRDRDGGPVATCKVEKGSVVVTLNGLIGDCGWSSSIVYKLLAGESLARLTQSEAKYHTYRESRDVFQVSECVTLTNREEYLMSTVFGFDGKRLLPPFLPVGRGQDRIWGLTLAACLDQGYIARLPWGIVHEPTESRSFQPRQASSDVIGTDFSSIVVALINSHTAVGHASPGEKLVSLGEHLGDIASLDVADFTEFLRLQLVRESQCLIEYLLGCLKSQGRGLPFWVEDIERFIETLGRAVLLPDFAVPLDLQYGREPSEARLLCQRLILQFGQLLRWWPTIWELTQNNISQRGPLTRPV